MQLLLAHKRFDAVHDQHSAWLVGAVYSGAVEQSTLKIMTVPAGAVRLIAGGRGVVIGWPVPGSLSSL